MRATMAIARDDSCRRPQCAAESATPPAAHLFSGADRLYPQWYAANGGTTGTPRTRAACPQSAGDTSRRPHERHRTFAHESPVFANTNHSAEDPYAGLSGPAITPVWSTPLHPWWAVR
ncbi:MAG: hypothetical protein M0T79_05380, partial [Actinomycetota bacterium]|nr:hypothetical protein [Actinomycetota bacterium]